MQNIDPAAILAALTTPAPLQLEQITSRESGLYMLYDHEQRPAYIGMTEAGLRDRIWGDHTSGDGNSHKFSTVYNAGRMFHSRKDPRTCPNDGKVAKKLRSLFARKYCRAMVYPIPGLTKADLLPIESSVLAIAPAEAKRWNDLKALDAIEPSHLVDELLDELQWNDTLRHALNRQAGRYQDLT